MGKIIKVSSGFGHDALLKGIRSMHSSDTLILESSKTIYKSKEIAAFPTVGGEFMIKGEAIDHCTINALFSIANAHVQIEDVILDATANRFNFHLIQVKNGGKLTLRNVIIKADPDYSPIYVENGQVSLSNVTIEYAEESKRFAIVARNSSQVEITESRIQNGMLIAGSDCAIANTELYGLQLQANKGASLKLQDVKYIIDERYNPIHLTESKATINNLKLANTFLTESFVISASNSQVEIGHSQFSEGNNWIGSHNSRFKITDMQFKTGCIWFDQGSTVEITDSSFTADLLRHPIYLDKSKASLSNISITNPRQSKKYMIYVQNKSEITLTNSEFTNSLLFLGVLDSQATLSKLKFEAGQIYFAEHSKAEIADVEFIAGDNLNAIRMDNSSVSLEKVIVSNPQNSLAETIRVNNHSHLKVNNTLFEVGQKWLRAVASNVDINDSQINDGALEFEAEATVAITNTQFQADSVNYPVTLHHSRGNLRNVKITNPWHSDVVSIQALAESELDIDDATVGNGVYYEGSRGRINYTSLMGMSQFIGSTVESAQLVVQPGDYKYALSCLQKSRLTIESLILKQDTVLGSSDSLIEINAVSSSPADKNYSFKINLA